MQVRSDYRFIFVGGCGRSGTTLVQKLLMAHNAIAGGPEFNFTDVLVDLCFEMLASTHGRLGYFVSSTDVAQNFRDFYRSFFANIVTDECLYVSEKTPSNILVGDRLLELFPEAKFLGMLRDGRDVLVSYLDVRRRYQADGKDNPRLTIQRICKMWNDAIDMHFKILEDQELSPRYYVIKFEELVTKPSEVIQSLSDFLGIPFQDTLLHPEKIGREEVYKHFSTYHYPKVMYEQPFDPSKIGRWRTTLSPPQKLVATVLLRKNLRRLGYV